MAFTTPDTPRSRPSTVNLAVMLLYALAGLLLLNGVLSLATLGAQQRATERAFEGTSMAGQGGGVQAAGQIVVTILLVVVFIVLAVLVGKGNRVGRILTWVFASLALCCTGALFALTALTEAGYEAARNDDPDLRPYSEVEAIFAEELPGWYTPVTTVLAVLIVLTAIAVIVLLALPKSHPYFRKAEATTWEPPLPPPSPAGGPSTVFPPGPSAPDTPGRDGPPGPVDPDAPAGPPRT